MQVTHGTIKKASGPPVALTIGNFDGVPLGPRPMLARPAAGARELRLPACVLTFEPHPREFFSPAAAPARLTRLREKLELIAEAGVARVHILRFDARLAGLSAQRFIDEVLAAGLGTRWLLVGRDFRFGTKRSGDFAMLESAAVRQGFGVEALPDVTYDGGRVSSSRVRAALAQGDLAGAASLLRRPHMMSGRVAHGEKLGRRLRLPTANNVFRPLRGVASVGRRPTVKENASPLLEIHLFDFEGELYGRHLRVRFKEKLRDERKFDGLEALSTAIRQDAEQARKYFEAHG